MSNILQSYFESTHSSELSETDLLNCIKGMPALFFRIEIVKNKIEYLNDYKIEGLGENTFLILKNKKISKELILEEDFFKYESFIQSVHASKETLAIIRIKTENGQIRWLKLFGGPNPYNLGFYLGILTDITPAIPIIEEINEKENEQQALLEMVDNPALLVNIENKKVVSFNRAAIELFGYTSDELQKLEFNDLYHHSFNFEMIKIFEDVIFEKKWEGKVFFQKKGTNKFLGRSILRLIKINNIRLLRISIYAVDMTSSLTTNNKLNFDQQYLSESNQSFINSLLQKMESVSDLSNILKILVNNSPEEEKYDAIIYSDIFTKKDKIAVYAEGDSFNNLKFGETYFYEGTIAENIEQYKLDHLIVDDTMSSIKAIDWALFIPNGIRSYFAKPFYERNTLRSVLILCSKKPNVFSDNKLETYSLLYEPFLKGLKNFRKASRTKKG